MEYLNRTPFPSLAFESLDAQGHAFRVAVLRMTLDILPDRRLEFAAKQSSLLMTDEFYNGTKDGGVKQESDLAPYKPRCDVIVIGSAIAPGGRPTRRFQTGVKIRRNNKTILDKQITVTGPRDWRKRFLLGWRLTQPAPIISLPLRYEHAYGGECRIETTDRAAKRIKERDRLSPQQKAQHPDGSEKAPEAHTCCEENPLGKRYAEKWYLKAKKIRRLPAPQIESVLDPIRKFGQLYSPQGLGVIARSWRPRIDLCGTIDEAFTRSDKPLPADFNFAYWNGAHPDLQIDWLQGNEVIELMNIKLHDSPKTFVDSGNLMTQLTLPGHHISALLTSTDGRCSSHDFKIDTLVVDADQKKIVLVYRLKLPKEPADELLETMLLNPEEKQVLEQHSRAVTEFGLQRAHWVQEAFHA